MLQRLESVSDSETIEDGDIVLEYIRSSAEDTPRREGQLVV